MSKFFGSTKSKPNKTKLISRKSILPTQTQQKWIEECNIEGDKCIKWYEAYQSAPKKHKTDRISIQTSFNKKWNKRRSEMLLL